MTLDVRDLEIAMVDIGGRPHVQVRQLAPVDHEHVLAHGPMAAAPLDLHGGDVGRATAAAIDSLEWVLSDPARVAEVMGSAS